MSLESHVTSLTYHLNIQKQSRFKRRYLTGKISEEISPI